MSDKVYVWDRFIRFFHWSLVLLVLVSYLTGENEVESIHPYSGYLIFILVVCRFIWGFIGSDYARFSQMIYSPRETMDYAKSLLSGRPKHYLGHNPLGALMVVALLLTLLATTLSGMQLYAVEENKGPFAHADQITLIEGAYASSYDEHDREHHYDDEHEYEGDDENEEQEEFWEEIHESCVSLLLFLVTVHIIAVIASSYLHHESLPKAMVSGYKHRKMLGD